MVTNATSLGRSGLFDWLIQRISALLLLAWAVCILASLLFTGGSGLRAMARAVRLSSYADIQPDSSAIPVRSRLGRHLDRNYRLS